MRHGCGFVGRCENKVSGEIENEESTEHKCFFICLFGTFECLQIIKYRMLVEQVNECLILLFINNYLTYSLGPRHDVPE